MRLIQFCLMKKNVSNMTFIVKGDFDDLMVSELEDEVLVGLISEDLETEECRQIWVIYEILYEVCFREGSEDFDDDDEVGLGL